MIVGFQSAERRAARTRPYRVRRGPGGPVLAVLMLVFASPFTVAYDFIPTQREFFSWPRYCQARYVEIGLAKATYERYVPSALREQLKVQLGPGVFIHAHHGCAGMSFFTRAMATTDPLERSRILKRAQGEARYTYQRVPPPHFVNITLRVLDAKIEMERGNYSAAREMLVATRADAPDNPEPYFELARLHYREKDLKAAEKVLVEGLDSVSAPSVDLHYFLGLVYFAMKDYDQAHEHAVLAYDLGSRLPGLKRKLESVGRWEG